MTVLVVDDSEDVRFILGRRLQRAGFDVVAAGDGRAGLELLDRTTPCCVLLDLMMPRLDGYGFLASLRQRLAAPPVYVVSQSDDPAARHRVRALGAEQFLTKGEAFAPQFADTLWQRFGRHAAACRSVPAAVGEGASRYGCACC